MPLPSPSLLPSPTLEPEAATTNYPFASVEDIAARLGREPYTGDERVRVETLLELASDEVLDALGKDDVWTASLSPVPRALRSVTIEAVVRVLSNPTGVQSQTEQLGSYSHTESYRAGTGGLTLTDQEARRARRAVFGTNSGTARAGGVYDDVTDIGLLNGHALPLGQ